LLTFSQLKALQKKGVVIGSHSMTHANLGAVSFEQLKDEILGSKKMLEQKLNTKIQYFAFPKGVYTDTALKLVKQAKYKAAFTVVSAPVGEYSLLTPRTIIDQFYSDREIISLLNPVVTFLKQTMNKINFWRLMPNI
jgi:peptidoglycan/xylan/chitin deacetylase (PgdA/CDA1 family)